MILECHSNLHPDCRCFPNCQVPGFTSFRSVYPDHQGQQPTRWSFGCTRVALQQQKRAHKRYSESCWPARSTSLPELAGFISGVCFDQQCQQAADRAFLIVTFIPLLGLLCAVILKYRPPSAEALKKDEVFNDPSTETYFEGPSGTSPERDSKGQLAFRAVSYTPWPVEAGQPGERLRIDVGPSSLTAPRTFVFERKLGPSSRIVAIKLPRPMGVIFEENKDKGQAVIAGFVEGSVAEQRNKLAKMSQQSGSGPQVGDVLRACTCVNLVYATQSLFGIQPPVRTIVVYGADGQRWPKVMAALKAGSRADGDVTLILERHSL